MMKWGKHNGIARGLRKISIIRGERAKATHTGNKHAARLVYVFDLEGNIVDKTESATDAIGKYFNTPTACIQHYIRNKKPYNGYYFSYDMNLFI